MSLLSVRELSVSIGNATLIDGVSFDLDRHERLGLIGESGSGKSLAALAVMGLLPSAMQLGGSIELDGQQVMGAPERDLQALRGAAAAVVFQEPLTALDPLMRLGRQIGHVLHLHARRSGQQMTRRAVSTQMISLLEQVALPEPERIARAYPHEVSGGQRQRVAIAMALACGPKLLIADEPTTSLDATTQAEILDLLDTLVAESGMALMFISHDLAVVSRIADRVVVMQTGLAVEQGTVAQIFRDPAHPYTRRLLESALAFEHALGGSDDPA